MLEANQYINFGGKLHSLETPLVMGVINVTPDSFFESSRSSNQTEVVNKVGKMVEEGATIIDIGAFTSKPGATLVSVDEEWKRLENILPLIRKEFPNVVISLGTYRSEIIKRACQVAGIDIVNDISGGAWDNTVFDTVAELGLAYVLMHIQGEPNSMQVNPVYKDVASEVILSLSKTLQTLKLKGICNIIVDPGFGFGKTVEQNFELLNRLSDFASFECPILVGISRKSMIHKTLNISSDDALNGTTALNMFALQQGAKILRVHDVKEAVECVTLFNALNPNLTNPINPTNPNQFKEI